MQKTALLIALLTFSLPIPSFADGDPSESESGPIAQPATEPAIPQMKEYACDFSSLVGKKESEIDRSQFGDRVVRSLKPNQMVTMEYLNGRINLQVNDEGIITAVTCG